MQRSVFPLVVVFLLFFQGGFATHIMGGNISYRHLEGRAYEVRVDYYKDCGDQSLDFPPAELRLGFFQQQGHQLILDFRLPIYSTDTVEILASGCFPQNALCLAKRVYLDTLSFESITLSSDSGYYFSYEQCCRFSDIKNILFPFASGITFFSGFPPIDLFAPSSIHNSSPVLLKDLNYVLCNTDLSTDSLKFFDADGDSLVFSWQAPLEGNTTEILSNSTGVGTPLSGPYPEVQWATGYGLQNIMDAQPDLSIGQTTGVITVFPQQLGLYSISLVVEEFRAGLKIAEHRKDVVYKVIPCTLRNPPQLQWINTEVQYWEAQQQTCLDFEASELDSIDQLAITLKNLHPIFANAAVQYSTDTSQRPATIRICITPSCVPSLDSFLNFTIEVNDQSCPTPLRDSITLSLPLKGLIEVDYFENIPNAVTPNNDGLNDFFFLPNASTLKSCYEVFDLKIFNRWGESVYRTADIQFQWNSEALPAGVYFYALRLGSQERIGFVQVMK